MTCGEPAGISARHGSLEGKAVDGILAADSAVCAAEGQEVRQLVWRMTQCVGRLDLVRSRMRRLGLQGWQSPGGDSYRGALAGKLAELDRCVREVEAATSLVSRHAVVLAAASGRDGY